MKLDTKYWLKFSIANLMLVSFLGVLMRYKIGFEFPYLNQKNIQNAHSHFAFSGWIAQTLYVLLVNFIQEKTTHSQIKHYKMLLLANLLCSYSMLISFAIQGYGSVSIILSTCTIIIAGFFIFYFLKDLRNISRNDPAIPWFKSALWFNIISSAGTIYLAYMLASKNFNENWYLASVYFFLHFQYNGFFIFTCLGLFHDQIQKILPSFKHDKLIFVLFFLSLFPTYFLSTLWAKLPLWLYIGVVIFAFTQMVAWIMLLNKIRKSLPSKKDLSRFSQNLFLFVAIAFTLKILLQLVSTIPFISRLAFGFRPVVIAYLHLVLLAVISAFLLSYMHLFKFISNNRLSFFSLLLFIIGVFLNELVLAVQGFASFAYLSTPGVNEILFGVALVLFLALVLLNLSQKKPSGLLT